MTTEERLEKLERELTNAKRRGRWMTLAVVLAVVAGAMAWIVVGIGRAVQAERKEDTAKVIRAQAFIVEDANGKTRVKLTTSTLGPGLSLHDETGLIRASLTAPENGPRLDLYDKAGKDCAFLSESQSCPGLGLSDKNGNTRVMLSVDEDGPGLTLFDPIIKSRVLLSAGKSGPSLYLYDSNKKVRAALGTGKTTSPDGKTTTYPESTLLLIGPDGKVVWSSP